MTLFFAAMRFQDFKNYKKYFIKITAINDDK